MRTEAECDAMENRWERTIFQATHPRLSWNFNNFQLKPGEETFCLSGIASAFNNPVRSARLNGKWKSESERGIFLVDCADQV
jgi:hypothetical protein